MITSQLPVTSPPLTETIALRHLLFGTQAEIHEPWRRLFSSDVFAYHEGLTHQERTELSYQRLRVVNAAVPDAQALARDPVALSALHEWAGVVDAGMTTMASIHYNLFLGSLLEHDHEGRDLGPYLRMERIGTFLCTEQAHGNDAPSWRPPRPWTGTRAVSCSPHRRGGHASGCPTLPWPAVLRMPWSPPVW